MKNIKNSIALQDWKGKVIPYETSDFDGLEMRIRGDGRTYTVNVQPDSVRTDDLHQTYVYTRGGPYWETIRVRFIVSINVFIMFSNLNF